MVNLLQNDSNPVTIDRSRLAGVQTPRATLSWTPLPHHELMNRVENRIQDYGYRIHQTNCLLSHGGDRFLGTITLGSRRNLGYRRMLGIKNSHDKSLAAGLIAGIRVIVCSNGTQFKRLQSTVIFVLSLLKVVSFHYYYFLFIIKY